MTRALCLIALAALTACETIIQDQPDGTCDPTTDVTTRDTTRDTEPTEPTRTEPARRTFLASLLSDSPIFEMTSPPLPDTSCAEATVGLQIDDGALVATEICDNAGCLELGIDRWTYTDRTGRTSPTPDLVLATGDPVSAGPVIPTVDSDDLLWLCREDEEEAVCICIPWAQD